MDIVDLMMSLMGDPPPTRVRKNMADKFIEQHGDYDRVEPSEDLKRKMERHNVVPKLKDELEKRETTGIVQMADSGLHLQKLTPPPPPSILYLADNNLIRFMQKCPACRKLKKFVELQRMGLKLPCNQKPEQKKDEAKQYPCRSRRPYKINKKAKGKFRRQNVRRRPQRNQDGDEDGRNTAVTIRSSNVSEESRQVSSRENIPNELDDDSEEPKVEE